MKRIIIPLLLSTFLFMGCEHQPFSDFTADKTFAKTGEDIYFTNYSDDADHFVWNFGDGLSSDVINPVHYYDNPGFYTVTLTAYNRNGGSDMTQMDIEIIYDTQLEVTVAEWNYEYVIEYIVPGASVRLYPSLYDWEKETNMVAEGFTNNNGVVVFDGLTPGLMYWIDIWAEEYDNVDIKKELPELIEVPPLRLGYTYSFIGWADYKPANSAKKIRVSTGELKSMRPAGKVKPTTKLK